VSVIEAKKAVPSRGRLLHLRLNNRRGWAWRGGDGPYYIIKSGKPSCLLSVAGERKACDKAPRYGFAGTKGKLITVLLRREAAGGGRAVKRKGRSH